ncbi:PAS domain-containing sensor histidine kinase [Ulvibacter antarcticus]|uniref:histidine kinase n=1 Tax=Ulvibacter antarcticus TaxID=442714 RepID=A0A3L9ZGK5_9FLAO|nr:PAS domain-containing sensor histidine kinase [Ulvibacter antarcticus]RMA65862.1 histidine kinase/DNA gyrase B/HSP90-like ATPase [Ulvibacter antarcticus]
MEESNKNPFDYFYYQEVADLTAAGGWSVNFDMKTSYLDPQARKILNVPENFQPSLRTALDFYPVIEKVRVTEFFEGCANGIPFNATLKMLTFDNKEFWVRAVGKPLYDDGTIVGAQGVFQDIDFEKLKELSLEKSLKVIESQNSRLLNFAHIVSHNLRSHSSNLQLTIELLNAVNSKNEEEELKESLVHISNSLNDTISHLNEIVSVQSKAHDQKKELLFEDVLYNIKNSINRLIIDTDTKIISDFSELPGMTYIHAYMESIFLNLISNAIKYKHPERAALIHIYSYLENGESYLMFQDNGIGIDLDTYGSKVFNMYQTFHQNEDAVGIGLFITKNQVEALQGTISIESVVNQGTIIKIKF